MLANRNHCFLLYFKVHFSVLPDVEEEEEGSWLVSVKDKEVGGS